MSKYGVFSGPYFPVYSPNTGKYRPEKTPHLDTFHAVHVINICIINASLYTVCSVILFSPQNSWSVISCLKKKCDSHKMKESEKRNHENKTS